MIDISEKYTDDLRFLVGALLDERAGEPGLPSAAGVAAASAGELWPLFRALVNIREPNPAPTGFLKVQDRLLTGIIADADITDADALPPTAGDTRLAIWHGDITTLAADAIVNAANSCMLGCWQPNHTCIDNAIHTFAGIQMRAECAEIMRAQGHDEPTGCAEVTRAYNLPARQVIHTVGPIVQGAPAPADDEALARCYRSCLDAAAGNGCRTVAFCCISTGVFGFPQRRAARVAVDAVRAWLDEHAAASAGADAGADTGNPTAEVRVIFNVFLESDEEIYHDLLD